MEVFNNILILLLYSYFPIFSDIVETDSEFNYSVGWTFNLIFLSYLIINFIFLAIHTIKNVINLFKILFANILKKSLKQNLDSKFPEIMKNNERFDTIQTLQP